MQRSFMPAKIIRWGGSSNKRHNYERRDAELHYSRPTLTWCLLSQSMDHVIVSFKSKETETLQNLETFFPGRKTLFVLTNPFCSQVCTIYIYINYIKYKIINIYILHTYVISMHCVPAFRIVSESLRGNQAANLGGWSCAIADR